MSKTVIKVENLSKQYRLGQVGTGTISHDLNRWWHRVRGKEDPYLKIGETNDRASKGNSEYVWALKDINFEVKQGEILGIIGKNGAGKSTLLKLLSKVTAPTTGSIKAKGRIASLLEVGTGFHPELTGRENIFLNGTILGMTKAEVKAKLDEIVAFAGVERYLDTPVKRYSSGMMVRLGFAVAAHLEPGILIVDEVLAVGDAEFQKKAIGKMQEVSQGQGRTVLFVSHNMGSVKKLCSRGILLSNGIIQKKGMIDIVLNEYLVGSNNKKNEFEIEKIPEGVGYVREAKVTIERKKEGLVAKVECFVVAKKDLNGLSLDIRIKDQKNQELGFGSIGGLNANDALYLRKGENIVSFFFPIDDLANGSYSLSFDLAEPNIQYLHKLEDCIHFELVRNTESQYRVLDQGWGYGSLELKLKRLPINV